MNVTCAGCGMAVAPPRWRYCSNKCSNKVRAQVHRDRQLGRRAECRRCGDSWHYRSGGGPVRPICPPCACIYKWCYACKQALPHERFASDRTTDDRRDSRCRACAAVDAAGRKQAQYESKRRYRYGITHEQYLTLVAEREGRCEICGVECKLNVDHCHSSGRVRGLLCSHCNSALGHFRDNAEVMNRAIEYLGRAEVDLRESG